MWSMYIAGEYGGMYGIMIKIYALTKKPEHLKAARLFLNEKLFYPMEENCDTLEDMHANQHIPQIIGAMDDFIVNGREQDWKISSNFWNIVTQRPHLLHWRCRRDRDVPSCRNHLRLSYG